MKRYYIHPLDSEFANQDNSGQWVKYKDAAAELAAALEENRRLREAVIKDEGETVGVLMAFWNVLQIAQMAKEGNVPSGRYVWFKTRAEAEAALDAALKTKGGAK